MVTMPAPGVQITLLQAFVVSVDREPLLLAASAQRLIAFLALHRRAVGRAYAAGRLWPDATSQKANASLRSTIWRIQRTSPRLLVASACELSLAPEAVVDVRGAEARAHQILDPSDDCAGVLTPQSIAEFSADLLLGWYEDDWIIVGREHFHQLRLHALESMCVRLTSLGRFGVAVEAGLTAVTAEPLRESAHDVLIKAHLAAGNRYEAIQQFERYRRVLLEELGLEPTYQLDPPASPAARHMGQGPHAQAASRRFVVTAFPLPVPDSVRARIGSERR